MRPTEWVFDHHEYGWWDRIRPWSLCDSKLAGCLPKLLSVKSRYLALQNWGGKCCSSVKAFDCVISLKEQWPLMLVLQPALVDCIPRKVKVLGGNVSFASKSSTLLKWILPYFWDLVPSFGTGAFEWCMGHHKSPVLQTHTISKCKGFFLW